MSVQEDIYRFRYEQQGQQSIDDARTKVLALDASMQQIKQTFVQGGMTTNGYASEVKRMAKEVAAAKADLAGLERVAAGPGANLRAVGQTIQATGRIAQDSAQGGFAAIVNNLEQMAQQASKAAGATPELATALGGVFQIVGVAALIAMPHIIEFFKSFTPEKVDPLKDSVDSLTERIEKLKEKVKEASGTPLDLYFKRNELAAAEADLKRMTAAIEAYNEIKNGKTKDEQASDSATKQILIDSDAEKALRTAEVQKQLRSDPAYRAALQKIDEIKNDPDYGSTVNSRGIVTKLNSQERANAIQKAEMEAQVARDNITKDGGSAEVQAAKIMKAGGPQLSDALRKAGQGGTADALDANTPQMIARQRAAKAEYDQSLQAVAEKKKQAAEEKQKKDQQRRDDDQLFEAANEEAVSSGKAITQARQEREREAKRKEAERKRGDTAEGRAINADAEDAVKAVGGLYGPELEQAMLRNRNSKNPVPDAQYRNSLQDQISERLRRDGITDRDGNPLGAEARAAAAEKLAGGASGDLQRRTLDLAANGIRGQQADQVLFLEMQAQIAELAQGYAILKAQRQQLAANNRANNTALRRGR